MILQSQQFPEVVSLDEPERFRENVRDVVLSADVAQFDFSFLHLVFEEVVPWIDVFRSVAESLIGNEGDHALAVGERQGWRVFVDVKGSQHLLDPNQFLTGLCKCIVFRFGRGESNNVLLLARPGYRSSE